jgi:hypothetical protein
MLNNWSTHGLGAVSKKQPERRYTEAQLLDGEETAIKLIKKYDDAHGYILSKDLSSAIPAYGLANAVKRRMKLVRCVVHGVAAYPVEFRYGVWRGI